MPTAAKLITGIFMAPYAMLAAELYRANLPDGVANYYFVLMNGLYGMVIGWKLVGGRAGRGITSGINNGITATVALVVVSLFFNSVRQMMYQSIDNRYRSLTEGLQDIPQMMFDYGLLLGHSDIIATLVIGAILVGILGESVARRWS